MTNNYEAGLAVRREVLGADYADKTIGSGEPTDLQKFFIEHGWGAIWTRDQLPRSTRSLLNIALLTALNRPQELAIHTRGALNNGCTPVEIREVVLHCAIYAGIPAAVDAMRVVDEHLSAD